MNLEEEELSVFARITDTVASSTGYLLVDKSDNGGFGGSGFQHLSNGRVDISSIKIAIDKKTGDTGEIKIGVITAIDAAGAAITWFFSLPFTNATENTIECSEVYLPMQLKCGVTGGKTTRIVSPDKDTSNTRFQNDTAILASTGANVIANVGDVVVDAIVSSGSYIFSVEIFYDGDADNS